MGDVSARDELQMMATGAVSQFLGRVPALAMAEVLDSLASSPDLLARLAIEAGAFVRYGGDCRACGGDFTLNTRCDSCGGSDLVTLYAVVTPPS